MFLEFSGELILVPRDHLKLIIGDLPPLLLDDALELFPVALDAIPVHGVLSVRLVVVGNQDD